MLGKLLRKEFRLCLHPAAIIMVLLCTMVLIPNYPYGVMYFYMGLGVFFISMSARENHDVLYGMILPVPKKELVTARFSFSIVLELIQLLLIGGCILLHNALFRPEAATNEVGMDANLALIGQGFLLFGLFHLIFFPMHYRDVSKVGKPFVIASIVQFLVIIADIVLCHAVPLFRDILDTRDPEHLGAKAIFTLVCLTFWIAATIMALRISQKRFEQLDIR